MDPASPHVEPPLSPAVASLLEDICRHVRVGMAVFDSDGCFVVAFGPELRAMGISSAQVNGVHYSALELLWPELSVPIRDALRGASTSQVLPWREQIKHVSLGPLLDGQGAVRGAILVTTDLTDRRVEEERKARAERMDSLARLAGGVAHDLNNLLSIVTMGTGLLVEALSSGQVAEAMSQVQVLERSVERGARLSRQLASFARRQVGPPTVIDLHAHLGPVHGFLQGLVGASVRLELRLGAQAPRVRVMPGQIEQIMVSLVQHAAAGMPQGGLVRIETASLELSADPELPAGPYVAIYVTDQARPLSTEANEHLFEPFFDADGRGGSLGLATCYGVAMQAGGRVRARGWEGGNQIEVLIPATSDELGASVEPPPSRRRAGLGFRVALVEDEEVLRDQLEQLLLTAGHAVVLAASDGQQALEWIEANPGVAQIVLSDVVMPRLSGVELANRLEGRVPVVLMSGFVGDGIERVSELGARFTVLVKPVRPDEILSAIDRALHGAHPQAG